MTSFEQVLSKKSIFRNPSVLSPHYVPKELPFRDHQIHEIMTLLSSALKGQKPRNLIIYGKTGTGKTCTVKYVMEEFLKAVKNSQNFSALELANSNTTKNANMHYVNCRIYNSRYRILQKIMKNYLPELEKSGFGLPFLYEKLIELASSGQQVVIVLDEVDMVKDLDELVYTLTRSNDEIKNGGVSLLGISNKLSFKDALDPRSRSSLYETEMVFPPYSAEQLQKILMQRVKEGFEDGVVDSSAINLAAAITSQETGDARYALKLLHRAGELAEQEKKERITDAEVEAARKKVEFDLTAETINTLPQMHQIVLHSIASLSLSGSKYTRLEKDSQDSLLFSGEVYEDYEHSCKKLGKRSRSTRWYREYLNDLEVLGLISTVPSSKGIRGHTTLIKMCSDPKSIKDILQKVLWPN